MGMNGSQGITRGQWLALTAALLGWMFDGAEMGVFSMVGRPALSDLMGPTDESVVGLWFSVVTAGFLVGAATGGVLFGWLGDRIGRVRAMTLSVLTYALFTGLCGLSMAPWQMATLRFIAALGMGGEWSLGVALVMEVWPNRSRAFMAGLIGAAANVGYMLVGVVGIFLAVILADVKPALLHIGFPSDWADALVAKQGWRLMMICGTLPAILTFFIRVFVPESERWQHEKAQGGTSHWATRDLLGVLIGVSGPALIIYLWAADRTVIGEWEMKHLLAIRLLGSAVGLLIATIGYLYPVVRYLQRYGQTTELDEHSAAPAMVRRMLLAALIAGVALLGTWSTAQWAPAWADKLIEEEHKAAGQTADEIAIIKSQVRAKEYTQIWAAVGAIVGTIAAALMGDWLGRRLTYMLFCIASLGSVLALFQLNTAYTPAMLVATFVMGVCTASFYGWLPLYLPELFRTAVRATGQGFSFNFGRILAAVGVLQTGNLMGLFKGGYPQACSVMSAIYLVGIAIIWLAPETKGQPLPE